MAFHLESQSILKLRDLLASGLLPPADAQLALSLLLQQLHAPAKAVEAVNASLTEICLLLLRDAPDALVRERAARVLGGLVRVQEGSARLAARTAEGGGALALAEGAAQDGALGVRRACAGALRSFAEWGGREAPRVLAGAPAALELLAQGVQGGGCGEEGVRALAAAVALAEGAAAALAGGAPTVVPALVGFLAAETAAALAGGGGGGGGGAPLRPAAAPPAPHLEPPSLPALAALRDLCIPDAGKAAALAAGAPAPVAASLAHPSPLVRAAAATALALMAQHLAALKAFLGGGAGGGAGEEEAQEDGPSALAARLLPLLLAPATAMAAAPAVQTVCGSARGRGAALAWALGEGAQAMRALARCCPTPATASDLLAILRAPLSDGGMRGVALAGLEECAPATVRGVPFAREILEACPEEAAAGLLAGMGGEGGRSGSGSSRGGAL
jgi:hypothetical protein